MPDLKKDFQWVAYKDANDFQVFKTSSETDRESQLAYK